MTSDDRLAALWGAGLRSEGIGPDEEWDPVDGDTFQLRHDSFWCAVSSGIIPDDEADEPHWMTSDASEQLLNNHN